MPTASFPRHPFASWPAALLAAPLLLSSFNAMAAPMVMRIPLTPAAAAPAALQAPVLGPFTVPDKTLADVPFALTPPTSTSLGGWTYASSNPAVATVSGDTVTLHSIGTTLITATQAAAGTYTSASASDTLRVASAGALQAAGVTGGSLHSMVLKLDGTVWSVGHNSKGELAQGSSDFNPHPTYQQALRVGGPLTGITKIAAGGSHTLALAGDGTVWAAGFNAQGQLGQGNTTGHFHFKPALTGVRDIAAYFHSSFAIKADNTLWVAGYNLSGQLGTGDTASRSTFQQVLTDVAAVYPGGTHTFAVKLDGTVWATGVNDFGQLGVGDFTARTVFTQAPGISGVVAMAPLGQWHALAVKSDGSLWGTGRNNRGQLGLGAISAGTSTFIPIPAVPAGVRSVAIGNTHSTVLMDDGRLLVTGENAVGQLGLGDTVNRTSFTTALTGVASVTTQRSANVATRTIALKTDGTLWGTGENSDGALGTGGNADVSVFTAASGMSGVTHVTGGGQHTLAVKADGSLWTVGLGTSGQLGLGTTSTRLTYGGPVPAP